MSHSARAALFEPPTNRARQVKNWSINKLSLDHTNDVYWIILGGIFAERDDIKSKLDAVFAKHDESKRKAVEAQHKESSFLRAFLDAREKTTRPAMVEVGEYVRGMGYTFRISTEEDGLF